MASLRFARDHAGHLHAVQAPPRLELTLTELCGAKAVLTAQGVHLVVCDEIRYRWVDSDHDRGVLVFAMDRDDREIL